MRITFGATYNTTIAAINKKNEDINRLSTMSATGKRLLKPSDDPLAWSQAMDMKQGLRELESFQGNIDFGVNWQQATDSALGQIADLVVQAQGVGTGSISVNSPEQQASHATQLNEILQQVMGLVNTRFGDLYIFSGSDTSTAPFDPNDPTYTYQGNTNAVMIRVGKNDQQAVSLDGQSAFITDPVVPGSNLLKQLADLKVAVEANDTSAIQTQLTALEASRQNLTTRQAAVGVNLNTLDQRKSTLASLHLDKTSQLSDVEDADMVDVVSQLQLKNTAFEAALQVTAMLSNLSLVKYL